MVATRIDTASSTARADTVAHILSAFGFEPGATVSGVAAGGRFLRGEGEVIESLDPTSGNTLARVRTPSQA